MAILRLRAKQSAGKKNRGKLKKKTKRAELKVVKDEDGAYWKDLNEVLDIIFEEAKRLKMTWGKLAASSGLAETTIFNLGNRFTRRPQFRSIRNVGLAVGMKIEMKRNKIIHSASSVAAKPGKKLRLVARTG